MIWNSLRWRMQIGHGLILTVVIAGFGVTAYRLARADRFRRIDEELQLRVSAVASVSRLDGTRGRGPGGPEGPGGPNLGPGPGRPFERGGPRFDGPRFEGGPRPGPRPDHPEPGGGPPGLELPLWPDLAALFGSSTNSFYCVLWQRDGSVQWQSTNAPLGVPYPGRPDAAGLRPAQTRDTFRECTQFTPSGRGILVGRPISAELAELEHQAAWLVGAGAGVLVAGLAVGWWVATRAIRPIEVIGATAARIAAGDLSHRINAAGTTDELGRLVDVLNSTFARLEAAFAHQARFTADAAHELRTPVTVLLTHVQNGLAADCGNPEHREALEACQRAAQRMRRLIESLLQLARLDAGQDTLPRGRVDLAETTRECVELIRPLAADRGLTLQTDLPATECPGDAGSIGQVLTNLLANAVRFSRTGGEVRIVVRSEAQAATVAITDTGPGISPEELPHVFERFHRTDRSRSRASGGTGLGLAISKAIVDAHGGTIAVDSPPGAGATFTVRLPLDRHRPTAIAAAENPTGRFAATPADAE